MQLPPRGPQRLHGGGVLQSEVMEATNSLSPDGAGDISAKSRNGWAPGPANALGSVGGGPVNAAAPARRVEGDGVLDATSISSSLLTCDSAWRLTTAPPSVPGGAGAESETGSRARATVLTSARRPTSASSIRWPFAGTFLNMVSETDQSGRRGVVHSPRSRPVDLTAYMLCRYGGATLAMAARIDWK